MKRRKTSSVEQLQLANRFEGLRKILMSSAYAEHLEKPLAYWALPRDRRLPLALMGRTLRDLLATSFGEIAATPGIGQKKVVSFVQLLARAANTDPAELPAETSNEPEASAAAGNGHSTPGNGFDLANVSEVSWGHWRASVVAYGLADEKLGRFASSLKHMTRVIWNTPLRAYTDVTLTEIRAMKTHGEKRVLAILEVFHSVHALVANMEPQEHLVVRIAPRSIDEVERWVGLALQRPGVPSEEEISTHFVGPLLEQVRVDATQQIASLAETRLGIPGPITSVRQVARNMGLTRARVYQLLNEINDIMVVRWPLGRHQVYELRDKFQAEIADLGDPPDLTQFRAAIELFYPGSRRGAAGPMEQSPEMAEEQEQLVAAH